MLVDITLNGFVKRTLNTEVLKVAIKSTGATLTRKGRSKNWLLQANDEQIRNIIKLVSQSEEISWHWLTKKLTEAKPKLNRDELKSIAIQNPSITISQLTLLTDCTHLDARIVLDEIEWE